jgi:hypothetical protein
MGGSVHRCSAHRTDHTSGALLHFLSTAERQFFFPTFTNLQYDPNGYLPYY